MFLRWTHNDVVNRWYLYDAASWTGYSVGYDSDTQTMSIARVMAGFAEDSFANSLDEAKAVVEARYVLGTS